VPRTRACPAEGARLERVKGRKPEVVPQGMRRTRRGRQTTSHAGLPRKSLTSEFHARQRQKGAWTSQERKSRYRAIVRQCESNTGSGGLATMLFVAPPRMKSRMREWP